LLRERINEGIVIAMCHVAEVLHADYVRPVPPELLGSVRSLLYRASRQSLGHGAVARPELRENALHMSLDGLFSNRKVLGDYLVGIAGGYLAQDVDFREWSTYRPQVF